jgi:4-hydroxybenzoate polyprenyltransferase
MPNAAPPLLRALRPHQWAKNALLLVPALAAHLAWTPALGLDLLGGFAAFSLLASALYLVNDVLDLRHDRLHPTKSRRPLASGQLSVATALGAAAVLFVAAAALALGRGVHFQLTLVAYLAINLAYSLDLKRRPVLDVIVLATLYATRVVAGAALVGVPLSRWFLAFSLFLFLSLALVKRVVELQALPDGVTGFVRGDGRGVHRRERARLLPLRHGRGRRAPLRAPGPPLGRPPAGALLAGAHLAHHEPRRHAR